MPLFEHQSYTWFAARARNALRWRLATSILASIVFLGALLGLVLIPRQANRTARAVQTQTERRPDTSTVLAARAEAIRQRTQIDSSLANARAKAQQATQRERAAQQAQMSSAVDTLPSELRIERDSLNALLVELSGAMTRAAGSPLPPAFRALGQTRALQGNPQVRQLLDSLDQIDKLREPFGALGAGDPIYVALTAHVNELGRSLRDVATLRRSELRARVAPLMPAPVAPPVLEARIDTLPLIAARAKAHQDLAEATQILQAMRTQNAAIDAQLVRARNLANLGAPPGAMLAAAFVLALVLAFSWAFAAELRYPRIAHPREAEAMSGVRVLTVIRPTEMVERSRRQSDTETPPLIDIVSDSYHALYLRLAATGASVPTIMITGDINPIIATVASNLSAIAAYEARSTLLVDTDTENNDVAGVFRLAAEPGISGLMLGRSDWIQSVKPVTIGRDRQLDVLPAGPESLAHAPPRDVDHVREELIRMGRRYDFVVIAAPLRYAELATNTIIPTQDTILCARIGHTRLSTLRAAIQGLQAVGRDIHGLVLWEEDIPRIEHHHG